MESFLLTIHLTGAGAVGILIATSLSALYLGKKGWYRPLATSIGIGGGVQLVTGSLLTLAMSGTLGAFCVRVGLYLAAIIAAELMLIYAMKREALTFPKAQALSPIGFGMAMSVVCMLILS